MFSGSPCSCYDLPGICSSPGGSHHWGSFLLCLLSSLAARSCVLVTEFLREKLYFALRLVHQLSSARGRWLLATLLLKDRTSGQPITRAPSVFQVIWNLPPVPRVRPRAQRPNCPGHLKAWAVSLLLPQSPSRWPDLLCMVGTSGFGSWAMSSKPLVDPSLEYIAICNICKCVTF